MKIYKINSCAWSCNMVVGLWLGIGCILIKESARGYGWINVDRERPVADRFVKFRGPQNAKNFSTTKSLLLNGTV